MVLLILYLLFQNICGWFYVKMMIYDMILMMPRCGILVDILYDDITWYYMMIFYNNEMSWGHDDGYIVLRAPIDGPMIEAAYGETMIDSTKTVWEILTREEWLGCRHDDIFWFSWYKNLYVLCFKSICIIKGTLVVSDFVLARRYSKKDFYRPLVLKKR